MKAKKENSVKRSNEMSVLATKAGIIYNQPGIREIFKAAVDILKNDLGYTSAIFIYKEGYWNLEYISMSEKQLEFARKLTGLTMNEFKVPGDYRVFDEITRNNSAIHIESSEKNSLEILEYAYGNLKDARNFIGKGLQSVLRSVSEKVMPFVERAAIIASIQNNGRIIGVLATFGEDLKPEDTPTLAHFAHIIASAVIRQITVDELTESEAKFRDLFESSSDGIAYFDDKGVLKDVNRKILELTKFEKETLVGKHFLELAPLFGLDAEAVTGGYERIMAEVPRDHLEREYTAPDGKTYILNARPSLIKREDRVIAFSLIVQDVTEKKIAEKAFSESEEKYRLLFESASEGIVYFDAKGTIIDINRKAAEISGSKPNEWIGKSMFALMEKSGIDLVAFRTVFKELTHGRPRKYGEWEFTDPDGARGVIRTRPFEIVKNGKIVAYAVLIEDISERKRMEAHLNAQKELSEALSVVSDLNEALRLCLKTAVEVSGMDAGGIYMVDEENGLDLVVHQGLSEEFTMALSRYDPEEMTTKLVMEGRTQYANYEELKKCFKPETEKLGFKAIALIPIKYENKVIGSLNIVSYRLTETPKENRNSLEMITAQMGGAIMRIKAEEARAKSEAKYKELVKNANSIILRLDGSGNIIYLNEYALEFFGYSEKEIIGRGVVGTIVPETESEGRNLAERISGIITNPDMYINNINENVKRNGERIWIAWTNRGIFDNNGNIESILCVGNDISELKRMKDELEELNSIIEKSPAVAFLWKNEEGWPVQLVSKNVRKLFGYTSEEFVSGKVAYVDTIHPEDINRVIEEIARFGKDDGKDSFNHLPYRIITKDRDVKWVSDSTMIKRDGNGRITHYQGIVIDITSRKLAEDALMRSRELHKATLEATGDAIVVFDSVGNTILSNEQFGKLGGAVENIIASNDVKKVVDNVSQSVEDSEEFTHKVKEAIASTNTAFETVKLRNGRIYERYTTPLIMKKELAGRVLRIRDVTELKRAEAAMQESEEKFRLLFESASEGIVYFDSSGRIAEVNRKALEIARMSREEIIGKSVIEMIDYMKIDRKSIAAAYEGYMNNKVYTEGEWEISNSVGERRILKVRPFEVLDSRKSLSLAVLIHDITETKRAEAALRDSEERFRMLAELSPLPISVIGKNGNYEFLNMKFVEVFGYTLNDLPDGKTWFRLAYPDPDYRAKVIATWKFDLADAEEHEIRPRNFTVRCKDGSDKEIVFLPATMYNGKQFIIYEDITERKRIENEIVKSRQKYESLVNNLQVGIYRRKPDGQFIEVNPAMLAMFEVNDKDELMALNVRDTYYNPGQFDAIKEKILKNGFIKEEEIELVSAKGRAFWTLCTLKAKVDENGEIIFDGTIYDITERKKAQEELIKNEMEMRALSHKTIALQEEERTRLSRELHDGLGQQLTALRWGIDSLKKTPLNEKDKEVLDSLVGIIKQSAEEIRRICRGLRPPFLDDLSFSLAIESLVREVSENCDMNIEFTAPAIDSDVVSPEIAIIVYRVLQEALNNAVKHSDARNASVYLEIGDYLLTLVVHDDGKGFNLESTGRGLGIIGMRERAALCWGSLYINSEPGAGTTVMLEVPLGKRIKEWIPV